jgi:hypothetical protein
VALGVASWFRFNNILTFHLVFLQHQGEIGNQQQDDLFELAEDTMDPIPDDEGDRVCHCLTIWWFFGLAS